MTCESDCWRLRNHPFCCRSRPLGARFREGSLLVQTPQYQVVQGQIQVDRQATQSTKFFRKQVDCRRLRGRLDAGFLLLRVGVRSCLQKRLKKVLSEVPDDVDYHAVTHQLEGVDALVRQSIGVRKTHKPGSLARCRCPCPDYFRAGYDKRLLRGATGSREHAVGDTIEPEIRPLLAFHLSGICPHPPGDGTNDTPVASSSIEVSSCPGGHQLQQSLRGFG